MAWPAAPVDTTDSDADTDNPLQARQDIFDLMVKVNAIIAWISPYVVTLLDDVDAPTARATLGSSTVGDAVFIAVSQLAARTAIGLQDAGFTTGDVKLTLKTVADTSWVLMNDGTIGDATSGGTTRANADTSALFTLLWSNTIDTDCPVSSGRGGSAAADFAAHKTIALPKALGRALACFGTGSGLTARRLAFITGEEGHVQSTAEMAIHGHGISDPGHVHGIPPNHDAVGSGADAGYLNNGFGLGFPSGSSATGVTVNNSGSSSPMNVMQPTVFLNVMIKL